MGRGVSTCATCDGFFFKDQDIMVVGGGDSAVEEALYLSRLGRSVTVVHRRDALRASKIMQERARTNPKIAFVGNTAVEEISTPGGEGEGRASARLTTDARPELPVDGLFIAIGTTRTRYFCDQVDLRRMATSRWRRHHTRLVAGVFAAGDVQDHVWRQAVTAAGTGAWPRVEAERTSSAGADRHGGSGAPQAPMRGSGTPGKSRGRPRKRGMDSSTTFRREGSSEIAEQRDRRQIRELASPRVLRRNVFDLDGELAELACRRTRWQVTGESGQPRRSDARQLRSDSRQRECGQDVHVGGEGPARLDGGPLEDQRLGG